MNGHKWSTDALTGRIKWPWDTENHKTYAACILTSPYAHGRLSGISLPPEDPDIVCISCKDIPGRKVLEIEDCTLPILAGDSILWHGQPIIAAAGKNVALVRDWLSRVVLKVEEGSDTEDAIPLVWESGSAMDVFSKAVHIVKESITIPIQEKSAEPIGIACLREGQDWCINVETQWPFLVRQNAALALNLPEHLIKVKPCKIESGASYSPVLWQSALFSTIAALLAWKAQKAIRLDLQPGDPALKASLTGVKFQLRAALNASGQLSALEASADIDSGKIMPFKSEILNRIIHGLLNLHPCSDYRIEGLLRHRNLPPTMLGPAGGCELGVTSGEILTSRIVGHRLASISDQERSSVTESIAGEIMFRKKQISFRKLVDSALSQSDYARKTAAFNQIRLNRGMIHTLVENYRGIGCSRSWFDNGFTNSSKKLSAASLSLTLKKNGSLVVNMPSAASSFLLDAWRSIAGNMLKIEPGQVSFVADSHTRTSGPSLFGQHVGVYTRLFELACQELSKRRFRDPLPITVERIKRIFNAYSRGVCIVEVSIFPQSSIINRVRIWLHIDGGRLLSFEHAYNAVEVAAEEALRWCAGASMRYILPQISIQFVNNEDKQLPKDVSSIPWLLVPAAFINALRQASGKDINTIPVEPWQFRLGENY